MQIFEPTEAIYYLNCGNGFIIHLKYDMLSYFSYIFKKLFLVLYQIVPKSYGALKPRKVEQMQTKRKAGLRWNFQENSKEK